MRTPNNPYHSMQMVAQQMGVEPIAMTEEKVNHIAKSAPRVQAISDFLEYLRGEGYSIMDNAAGRPLSKEEGAGLILQHVGVTTEEAAEVSQWVARTIKFLIRQE